MNQQLCECGHDKASHLEAGCYVMTKEWLKFCKCQEFKEVENG